MSSKKIKLSLSNVKRRKKQDPLKKFEASMRSEETKNSYKKTFREILDSIEDLNGTFEDKARQFYDLAKTDTDNIQELLEQYGIHLNERSKKPKDSEDYLNPNTFTNKFKGMKKFCKINRIAIIWDSIMEFEPEKNNNKQTRGFTTEEIITILEHSTNIQTDFAILLMSSCGSRAGELELLRWEQISPIYEQNGEYSFEESDNSRIICACVIVYAGTSSEYRTLISIEAWNKLQSLKKQWVQKAKRKPTGADHIFIKKGSGIMPFAKNGIKNKVAKTVVKSQVQIKQMGERRCDNPVTHANRKRYNKIMSESENRNDSHGNHIRKERLMGHTTGISNLEGNYFFSDILESVPQYLQAMPELMISDEYRTRYLLEQERKEKTQLDTESQQKKDDFKEAIKELTLKVERVEKYQKKEN
jgi:integrase